jgi:hypothetical protein
MPLRRSFLHDEGGTPTPFNLFLGSLLATSYSPLTLVFATHPEIRLVSSLLATHPKTQALKVLCLSHIQEMAGVGYRNVRMRLSRYNVSLCRAGDTSFSLRHRASVARKRYAEPGLLAPYSFKHLQVQSASAFRTSSGARIAVVFQEAALAVATQLTPRKCRKLVPFRGDHAK